MNSIAAIDKLKGLIHKHDRIIKNIEVIDEALKNKYWLKVVSPRGEFYIEDEEIKILKEFYVKKKAAIENEALNSLKEEFESTMRKGDDET